MTNSPDIRSDQPESIRLDRLEMLTQQNSNSISMLFSELRRISSAVDAFKIDSYTKDVLTELQKVGAVLDKLSDSEAK